MADTFRIVTPESEARMERRRYERRYPFSGRLRPLLRLHCMAAGILKGGRPLCGATLHETVGLTPMLGLASA